MTSTELTPTMPTRRLLSGLHVPDFGDDTAPLDVTHLHDEPTPAPKSEPEPTTAQPRPEPPTPSPAPVEVFRPENPTPAPAPVATSTTTPPEKAPTPKPKRTVRAAFVDWLDRRSSTKNPGEDDEITTGAFTAVCVVTLVVAGLAFALSFDMMLTAAKHYGWTGWMAKLFPIIIDVGAIGGTFMGSISANATYRRIGHQVLLVTLAASVLFNLVGHDIRGGSVAGLPEEWAWTGTVAAVLIPMLLAYFVHAFSKALKTYTDQRRAASTDQRRAASDRAKQEQDRKNDAVQNLLVTPTQPKPAPVPAPRTASPAHAAAPKAKPAAKSTSRPKAKSKGKVATKQIAVQLGVERRADTPAALARVLHDSGYAPSPESTIKSWCREIKAQLATTQ